MADNIIPTPSDQTQLPINVPGQAMTDQPALPGLNGAIETGMPETSTENQSISADEIALYDRQIRLWGVQAQEKIRTARVLLIGLRGLGNEIAKNLVLAGIGSLTIVDDQVVTEEDLGAQFLYFDKDIGRNKAEAAKTELLAMNPRVKLVTNTSSVMDLLKTPQFFQEFTVVIATDLSVDILQTVNSVCRLCSKPFYAAASHGLFGFVFADLIQHTFVIEREKSNMTTKIGPETVTRSVVATTTKKSDAGKTIELVTKTEQYSPLNLVVNSLLPLDRVSTRRRKQQITPILSCIKGLWQFQITTARQFPDETSKEDLAMFTKLVTDWHKNILQLPAESLKAETLRQFLQGVSTEISPVCAMLGGALAQNVIYVVGQNEQPFQNLLIWDSEELTGEIYAMHPMAPPVVPTLAGQIPIDMAMGMPGPAAHGMASNGTAVNGTGMGHGMINGSNVI